MKRAILRFDDATLLAILLGKAEIVTEFPPDMRWCGTWLDHQSGSIDIVVESASFAEVTPGCRYRQLDLTFRTKGGVA